MYDTIIVGGGHNGLTCGAYLAKAGHKVLLLEANPSVGGFVMTEEIPGAPGFKMNPFAIEFPFAAIQPSVTKELGLDRFGLAWASPDPHNTYLSPDGSSFSLWHDLDKTCESIARLSKKDAVYYESVMRPLMAIAQVAMPYLMGHPTRLSAQTVAQIARRLVKHRKEVLPGVRLLLSSPLDIISAFESEELRSYFAMNVATGSFRPLDEPLNTSIFLYFAILHLHPLQRPIGGSGAFPDALAACFTDLGGELRTSAPVLQILVEDGRATGVRLASGEELASKRVVSAADPTSLFTRLLDPSVVPPDVLVEVERMSVVSSGISHFKGDLALSRRPTFPKHELPEDFLGGVSIAPSVEMVQRIMDACKLGEVSDEIEVYIALPSILDRSMVPEDSTGESVFVWVGAVPYELSDGRKWDDVKDDYLAKIIDVLDDYSPGFKDSVITAFASTPDDFNNKYVFKGTARGVDLVPHQMGPWRPSPLLGGYRTQIDDLWHTGHGAHPMSGTHGWSGRTAARTILKERKGLGRFKRSRRTTT